MINPYTNIGQGGMFSLTPEQQKSMTDALAGANWGSTSNDPWGSLAQIGTNIEEASKTDEGAAQIKTLQDYGTSVTTAPKIDFTSQAKADMAAAQKSGDRTYQALAAANLQNANILQDKQQGLLTGDIYSGFTPNQEVASLLQPASNLGEYKYAQWRTNTAGPASNPYLNVGLNIATGGAWGVATSTFGAIDAAVNGDLKGAAINAAGAYSGYLNVEAKALTESLEAAKAAGNTAAASQISGELSDIARNKAAVEVAKSVASGNYGAAILGGAPLAGIDLVGNVAENLGDGLFGLDARETAELGLKSAAALADGASPEKVALKALEYYGKNADFEGGIDIDFDTPEFLKEFDKNVLQPTKDAIADAGGAIYEDVIKPAGQTVADAVEPLYEAQKPVGQAIADAGEAVYEAQKPVGQAIADTAEAGYEVVKDVGKAIDDTIIDPIDEALRKIDLPDINGPNIDIDWPDMPDINWASLFSGGLGAMQLLDGFMGGIGRSGSGSITDEFLEGRALKHRLNTDVTVFDKVDINQFNRTT